MLPVTKKQENSQQHGNVGKKGQMELKFNQGNGHWQNHGDKTIEGMFKTETTYLFFYSLNIYMYILLFFYYYILLWVAHLGIVLLLCIICKEGKLSAFQGVHCLWRKERHKPNPRSRGLKYNRYIQAWAQEQVHLFSPLVKNVFRMFFLEISECYGLNYVSPKFLCWCPNTQCDTV